MSTVKALFKFNGKDFIFLSTENKIKFFDVESQKEKRSYTEKHSLNHSYVCSSWSNYFSSQKDNLGLFSVGASDGKIIIWDLNRGVVSKTLELDDENAPLDLCFSNDHKSIYVSTQQNQILEYELNSGSLTNSFKVGKKIAQKIAMNPKTSAIAIGR